MDFVVTVYGAEDLILDQWYIENRTELEAFNEAYADVQKFEGREDWSLMPVKEATDEEIDLSFDAYR